MSKEKMTPLDEKKERGYSTEWFFADHVKKAVRGLIAEFKDDVYHGYEIQTIIKKHFGAGLTDE